MIRAEVVDVILEETRRTALVYDEAGFLTRASITPNHEPSTGERVGLIVDQIWHTSQGPRATYRLIPLIS